MGTSRRFRVVVRVLLLSLACSFLVTIAAPAQAFHCDPTQGGCPPHPFEPAPCLEQQVAAQWNIIDPPTTVADGVDRKAMSVTGPYNMFFTATGPEVKVAAPGVLENDYFTLSTGDVTVPNWNDRVGVPDVTAELVRPPDHASSFTLRPDGSFEWYPTPGYTGPDSFEYVAEFSGDCAIQATVQISDIRISTLVPRLGDPVPPLVTTNIVYPEADEFVSYGDGVLDASLFGVLANDLYATVGTQVSSIRIGTFTTTQWTNPIALEHGDLTLHRSGTFTFEPDVGFRGTQSFAYKVGNQGPPFSGPVPVNLVIRDFVPTTQARGVDDALTTPEDTPLLIPRSQLLANDQLAGFITRVGTTAINNPLEFKTLHGTLEIAWVLDDGGTANLHASNVMYTPDPNFHGVDGFNYWVTTSLINLATATDFPGHVVIDVTPVSEDPTAHDDTASTLENQAVTIPVLANDEDDDGTGQLDILLEATCDCATYTVDDETGTVTVTPDPEYVGPANFRYAVEDFDTNLSPLAAVSVTVNRDDAADDTYEVTEDNPLVQTTPGVRANDEDGANFTDVLETVTQPQHGVLDLEPDGSFRYVPAADYTGGDSFTYAYRNSSNQLGDLGTVTLDIAAVNDAPTVALQARCTPGTVCLDDAPRDVTEGGTVTLNGYLVDVEHDQGELTIDWGDGTTTEAEYPCEGTGCAFQTNPTFSTTRPCFDPPSGPPTCPQLLYFSFTHTYEDDPTAANDLFTIQGSGDDGATRSPATTTARVTNVAPTLTLLSPSTVDASNGQPVSVSASVTDPGDNSPLMVDWGDGSPATAASIVIDPTPDDTTEFTAQHTYAKRPAPYTATLSVDDGDGGTDSELVTVSANSRPTAQDITATTAEDTPVTVPGDVDDVDGDPLTLSDVTDPAHGSVAMVAGGMRYTPDDDYAGPDSFTYKASDGSAVSLPATVSMTVTPVNDLPTVDPIADATGVYSDAITSITVTGDDIETPAADLDYSAQGLPAGLSLAESGGSASISGTLTAVPGSYPVTVQVCDPDQGCESTDFTIDVASEDAQVRFASASPYSVQTGRLGRPGLGAAATTITARITDTDDDSFGDLTRVNSSTARVAVQPVGGGTTTTCPVSVVQRVAATATTPGFVDVSCTFPAGLAVNVYEITASVTGSFTGAAARFLVVYDPLAQGTTGAGAVVLPNGNTASFGFAAAAAKRSVTGKFVLLEHSPAGAVVNRVRATSLSSLAIGTARPKTVRFTGNAITNTVGSYAFVVTGTDSGGATSTATSPDTFGLQLTPPGGGPSVPSLNFSARTVQTGGNVYAR